jgi:DNA-binding HxlR family transcriptional regulator
MLPRSYTGQHCSVASTLEVIGDRWTLLVIREAFLGTRRFADFQERLGVARTVLSDRLSRLTEDGVLARVRYQERPERFEYRLTPKGLDLWPVLHALMQWGDRYLMDEDERPLIVRHRDCGGELDDRRICTRCGQAVELRDLRAERQPGSEPAAV